VTDDEVKAFVSESLRAVSAVHPVGPKSVREPADIFQAASAKSADFRGVLDKAKDERLTACDAFLVEARAAVQLDRA